MDWINLSGVFIATITGSLLLYRVHMNMLGSRLTDSENATLFGVMIVFAIGVTMLFV